MEHFATNKINALFFSFFLEVILLLKKMEEYVVIILFSGIVEDAYITHILNYK